MATQTNLFKGKVKEPKKYVRQKKNLNNNNNNNTLAHVSVYTYLPNTQMNTLVKITKQKVLTNSIESRYVKSRVDKCIARQSTLVPPKHDNLNMSTQAKCHNVK